MASLLPSAKPDISTRLIGAGRADPFEKGISREALDAFIADHVSSIEALGVVEIAERGVPVDDFLVAYVMARCLPVAVETFTPPADDGFDFDAFADRISVITTDSERYLDHWHPRAPFEAALLLDYVASLEDGPCCNTSNILGNVLGFLLGEAHTSDSPIHWLTKQTDGWRPRREKPPADLSAWSGETGLQDP